MKFWYNIFNNDMKNILGCNIAQTEANHRNSCLHFQRDGKMRYSSK